MIEQLVTAFLDEARPTVPACIIRCADKLLWHRALLVACLRAARKQVRRLGAPACACPHADRLVGHLKEQQIRQLLRACPERSRRVVTIRHAVVAQDVAVVPEFLDYGAGVHRSSFCITLPTPAKEIFLVII